MRVRTSTKHSIVCSVCVVGLKTLAYFISSLFTKPFFLNFHKNQFSLKLLKIYCKSLYPVILFRLA